MTTLLIRIPPSAREFSQKYDYLQRLEGLCVERGTALRIATDQTLVLESDCDGCMSNDLTPAQVSAFVNIFIAENMDGQVVVENLE